MEFDKEGFADAFSRVLNREDWTLQEVARMLDVSVTAVSNWARGDVVDKPHRKRWAVVKEKLGVDPADYVKSSVNVAGDRSQGIIIASNGATVNSACNATGDEGLVRLTPFEREILYLFRKFGNQSMAERCLKQLKAIEAMSI